MKFEPKTKNPKPTTPPAFVHESLSATTIREGDKNDLIAELNKLDHDCTSLSMFVRVGINLQLEKLGSNFRILER